MKKWKLRLIPIFHQRRWVILHSDPQHILSQLQSEQLSKSTKNAEVFSCLKKICAFFWNWGRNSSVFYFCPVFTQQSVCLGFFSSLILLNKVPANYTPLMVFKKNCIKLKICLKIQITASLWDRVNLLQQFYETFFMPILSLLSLMVRGNRTLRIHKKDNFRILE